MSQTLINKQSGQPEEISHDNLLPTLQSGKYSMPSSDPVSLKNPAGEFVDVNPEDAYSAVHEKGYSVPSEHEFQSFQNQLKYGDGAVNKAKAFGAGLVDSVPFVGGSIRKGIQAGAGIPDEEWDGPAQANPLSHAAGEIAGVAGQIFIGGPGEAVSAATDALRVAEATKDVEGIASATKALNQAKTAFGGLDILNPTSAIAKAGAKVAETVGVAPELATPAQKLLYQIGGKALGSAVEGSLYSTGQLANEYTIGDPKLTGEQVAAQIGLSALLAGGFGAAIEGGSQASSKLFGSIKDAAVKEAVAQELKESTLIDASGNPFYLAAEDGIKKSEADLSAQGKSVFNKIKDASGDLAFAFSSPKAFAVKKALSFAWNALDKYADKEVKYNVLAAIEKAKQKAANTLERGIGAVLEGSDELHPKIASMISNKVTEDPEKTRKDFEKRVDKITKLSTNPSVMQDSIEKSTQGIQNVAPDTAASIQGTLERGVNFLNQKIPKNPIQLPLSPKFHPSNGEIQKFNRYYRAVQKPLSVLEDMKSNALSSEGLEAIKTVHPNLYSAMQREIFDQITDKPEGIPYQKKLMLSMFLGQPLDASIQGQNIMANQASYIAQKMGLGKSEGAKVKSTQGGLDKLNSASRLTPNLTKIANRENGTA